MAADSLLTQTEIAVHCNTLYHTLTHYNTLKHTAVCTLHHTVSHCITLQSAHCTPGARKLTKYASSSQNPVHNKGHFDVRFYTVINVKMSVVKKQMSD